MACATVQQRPLPVSASEIRIEQMRQHSKSLIRLFLAVNDTGTYTGAYTHTHPHCGSEKFTFIPTDESRAMESGCHEPLQTGK